jgi:hypothetical protein
MYFSAHSLYSHIKLSVQIVITKQVFYHDNNINFLYRCELHPLHVDSVSLDRTKRNLYSEREKMSHDSTPRPHISLSYVSPPAYVLIFTPLQYSNAWALGLVTESWRGIEQWAESGKSSPPTTGLLSVVIF